ncbi:hypothetical protein HK104_007473, partial [Borealophlyctis nickersoniae]
PDTPTLPTLASLPLEVIRGVAQVADTETGRNIKCLNKYFSYLITTDNLVLAEAKYRWRVKGNIDVLFWAVRKGHAEIVPQVVPDRQPILVPIEGLDITSSVMGVCKKSMDGDVVDARDVALVLAGYYCQ